MDAVLDRDKLRDLRHAADMSQVALAHAASVHPMTLSRHERGAKRCTDLTVICGYADALRVDYRTLLVDGDVSMVEALTQQFADLVSRMVRVGVEEELSRRLATG